MVLSGRSLPELQALADEIRLMGGRATPIQAEVTDFEQLEALARQAVDTYGRIDTWVHSAAVMMYAPFEETTHEEFKRVIDVNLLGSIYGAKAALPHLKRTGKGALILISSIEARRALPLQSAYAASKHGMVGFLDALRMELQHEGIPISVTNVKPSGINTPLYDKALTRLGVKPRPVPPLYEPETAARAIVHAAESPVRDIAIGGAGKVLALSQRLSPKLADSVLMQIAFEGQRTDQPKSSDAPHNLYQHLDGFDRVRGNFSEEAKEVSLYTRLVTNPVMKWGVAAFLAAGVILISGRMLRARI